MLAQIIKTVRKNSFLIQKTSFGFSRLRELKDF